MRRTMAVALALAVALPAQALAGKKPKDKKKAADDAAVVVTFAPDQRESVRVYFVEKHGRGKCPPGLAKKNNGCLPPGQAKKRYSVGHPLPPGIVLQPLSPEISVRIGLPPTGYRYGMIDGDIVKLAIGTMLVVDAINGLVD
jgi:hypothetical protein